MPYVINPQSVMTAVIVGRHENQEVMSVFHYRYNGSQIIQDGEALLNAFHVQFAGVNGVWGPWRECVSNKVINIKLRYQWITQSRFAYVEHIPAAGTTGNVGGDAYPVNTAVAITKRTINAGRTQVGTLHMPGVPLTFVTNGALQQNAKEAYTTLGEKMLNAISTAQPAAELLPVLFHKSSPDISPKITAFSLKDFARIMRRRTVGVGS